MHNKTSSFIYSTYPSPAMRSLPISLHAHSVFFDACAWRDDDRLIRRRINKYEIS